MVFNNSILLGAAGQADAEFDTTLIGKSVWLDGSSDGFVRSASDFDDEDGKEFTLGTWFQLTELSVTGALFCAGITSDYTSIRHGVDNKIYFQTQVGDAILSTPNVFRDIGWYHILVSVDTTQSTASNRVRLFINGEEVTFSGTQPDQNRAYKFNTAQIHEIGDSYENGAFEGYLAQSFMIGSKSIQQGDFAITDFLDTFTFGSNGSQFIPKKHSEIKTLVDAGSDNSFLLDFDPADPTVSNALGLDISTYGNNFTSTSMGSANQSESTPSNLYPVINIIDHSNNTLPTTSEGNLRSAGPGASIACMRTTIPIPTTGKWYWEAKWNSVASARIGFAESNSQLLSNCGQSALSWGIQNDGKLVNNNSEGSALFSWSTNDIIAMAYDADNSKFWFGRIASGTTSVTWASSGNPETGANATVTSVPTQITPALDTNTGDVSLFFPEEDWTLSSKLSGFKEINSANLTTPEDQGIDYFNAVKYTGNGTAIGSGGNAVTGAGFKPDWVWLKNRSAGDNHALYDIARGVTKQLESNTGAAESTQTEGLTTFGSDGFTVGSLDQVNTNTENFISWNWLASNSTSTTSPAGTIASTSSVASAGHFSVGTYTGQTDAGTVGHGLGGVAEMVIVWDKGFTNSIAVYHVGVASDAATDYLLLSQADGATDDATFWNDTTPTSSVFSVGTGNNTNGNGRAKSFQAFRSVPGVCKVGSYTGDGGSTAPPYVYLGFRPRFIMFKNATVARDWVITDTARSPSNPAELFLFPNEEEAEAARGPASGSDYDVDLLADGFRPITGDSALNGTGNTIVYMAMADIGGNGTLPPIYGR